MLVEISRAAAAMLEEDVMLMMFVLKKLCL